MFTCSSCRNRQFGEGQAFLTHFVTVHSKQILARSMFCCHSDCIGRKFDKLNSFRKHVLKHKASVIPSQDDDRNDESETETRAEPDFDMRETPQNVNLSENENPNVNIESEDPNSLSNSLNFDNALTEAVLNYIGSLYDSGNFNENQIQKIIEGHMQLLSGGFLSILKDSVEGLLLKAVKADIVSSDELNNITNMFSSCQNLFQGFETEHSREREVEGSGAYIKPESFVIGPANDHSVIDGHVVTEPITLTGQFIPFRKMLKGFLELPGVWEEIQSYVCYLENTSHNDSDRLEDIIQGDLWKTIIKPKFPGKCLLPLEFNFDDYETNKELGTHTLVHKLGAGYVRIGCLPPKFRSLLENIFLVVLYHSSDRAFGNKKVFRKVINEFKCLEENGITIVLPHETKRVYFALCLVTGDNLGQNSILELVESFSANFFCRLCITSLHESRTHVELDPAKIRTVKSYERDVLLNQPKSTGIKGECIFNELQSFHVVQNTYLDIMHDCDEGCWKYLMYAVIKYLYDQRRFSISYLNELIQKFFYGCEEKNRLPSITKDDLCKSKRLRLSASEARCLVRYFCLMVGQEDKAVWNVYLTARQIVDLITAPVILKSDLDLLKTLIEKHHTEYQRIFKKHLTPKFHLMLHQPDVIKKVGPLEPISCYRTESKHREGKIVAQRSNSRINLPFTIAKRHQLKFAYRLLSGRGLVSRFEFSNLKVVSVQGIPDFSKFKSVVPSNRIKTTWNVAKWLKVNGGTKKDVSFFIL